MSGIGFIPEGIEETSPWIIYIIEADPDFVDAMGMDLVAGRNFSDEYGTDSMAVIINETLVKKLGWDEPLGKKIRGFGTEHPGEFHVVGVVRDFHFKTLHDPIEPSMIVNQKSQPYYLSIRLAPGDAMQNVDLVRTKWEELEGAFPFDYFFLDEDFEDQYRSETKMGDLFIFFTLLAVFVACLGLFGLSAYTAERRTREIGIRKVFGASVESLVVKLGREFAGWVLLANLVAWPAAYWLIDNWLQSFAYRIKILEFSWVFFFSAGLALLIALMTVTGQALRAATSDPVKALKYE
jgi:putative ABC transport system permease protein